MLLAMRAYLNASEVAKLLKVNRATVARWAQKGLLKGAVRVQGTFQWRIPLSTYAELVTRTQKNEKS